MLDAKMFLPPLNSALFDFNVYAINFNLLCKRFHFCVVLYPRKRLDASRPSSSLSLGSAFTDVSPKLELGLAYDCCCATLKSLATCSTASSTSLPDEIKLST